MVFRKPYAFLIKHFKLLHLILTGLMIYLSVRINSIYSLFDKLTSNVSVSFIDLSDKYINILMYLSIIAIIGLVFVIWFLMKNKNKPTKFYLFTIVYYIIILIFLIVYNSAIKTLEEVSFTNQALLAYRDISFLLPLGQYYFIVIFLLRGIGFNIKQFNFSKDIKDLEISEKDSEEIEVSLSNNTYKYMRFGRRRLRELKYYFFENKYWILLIVGIVIVGASIYIFTNYKFVNNNYGENTNVNANYYNFAVKRTLVLKNNLYGKAVKQGKKYVIIDLKVRNNYYQQVPFDIKNFRLFINDNFYYPVSHKNSDFKDIGLPYDNKYLDLENEYNYILIYELDEKISTKNMKLKVYDNMNYETAKVNYININLKPKVFDETVISTNVEINKEVVLDKTNFGDSTFLIKDYQFLNNYEYNYDYCLNKECTKKTDVIVPNDILNNKLLMVEYDLSLEKNNQINNFVTKDSEFFNIFVTLSYALDGKKKSMKFKSKSNTNIKNKVFVEVSKEIERATDIKLIVNTRNTKYIYKLTI